MKINGTNFQVYLDRAGSMETVAFATECTLAIETEAITATDKGDLGFQDILAGVTSWSVDTANLCSFNVGVNNANQLSRRQLSKEFVYVKIDSVDANQGNDFYYWGKALITSLSLTAANEDVMTFSVTMEGKGTLRQVARLNSIDALAVTDITYSNNKLYASSSIDELIESYDFNGTVKTNTSTLTDTPLLISAIGDKVAVYSDTLTDPNLKIVNTKTNIEQEIANTLLVPIVDIKYVGSYVYAVRESGVSGGILIRPLSGGSSVSVGITSVYLSLDNKGLFYQFSVNGFRFYNYEDLKQSLTTNTEITVSGLTGVLYYATQNHYYWITLSRDGVNTYIQFTEKNTLTVYETLLSSDDTATNDFKILLDENEDVIVYGHNVSASVNYIEKFDGKNRKSKGEITTANNIQYLKGVNCGDGLLAFADTSGLETSIEIVNNIL